MKALTESLKIILLCIVAAIVYGILHDQVTARVCVEYFTIGHTPIFSTESPTLLAFGWGILATWWVGLILGILAALASGVGAWPKLDVAQLVRPIIGLLIVMAVVSLLEGITGYRLAKASGLVLPEPFGHRIPKAHHCLFFADSLAHLASYLVGVIGGLILCLQVLVQRRRMTHGNGTKPTGYPIVVVSRWTARSVSIPLFGLVAVFVFGDGVPNPLTASLQETLLSIVVVMMFVGLVLVWKWEEVGGLLMFGGLPLFAASTQGFLLNIVLIPWLVAGLLYLVCWWGKNRAIGLR